MGAGLPTLGDADVGARCGARDRDHLEGTAGGGEDPRIGDLGDLRLVLVDGLPVAVHDLGDDIVVGVLAESGEVGVRVGHLLGAYRRAAEHDGEHGLESRLVHTHAFGHVHDLLRSHGERELGVHRIHRVVGRLREVDDAEGGTGVADRPDVGAVG